VSWVSPRANTTGWNCVRPGDFLEVLGSPPSRCSITSVLLRSDPTFATLSFRSGRRAADPRAEMVSAKGLGDEARQTQWAPKGHSRRRTQARGHSAPHVGRRDRVQLVDEGGRRVTRNKEITEFPHGRERRPCQDDDGGEIARFFASS